jgi:hypothetical protein
VTGRLARLRFDGPLLDRVPPGVLAVPDWWLAVPAAMVAVLAALLPSDDPALVLAPGCLALLLGVVSRLGDRTRSWSWLTPPALRLLEYATLWAAGRVTGTAGSVAAFAAIAVVALHHYDVVYRVRTGEPLPSAAWSAALGGWEVRTALVLLGLAVGLATEVAWALAVWCAAVVVTDRARRFARAAGGRG